MTEGEFQINKRKTKKKCQINNTVRMSWRQLARRWWWPRISWPPISMYNIVYMYGLLLGWAGDSEQGGGDGQGQAGHQPLHPPGPGGHLGQQPGPISPPSQGELPKKAQHDHRMCSACDQHMYTMWSPHAQHVITTCSAFDDHMFNLWPPPINVVTTCWNPIFMWSTVIKSSLG